jgi:hypothetical protein
MRPAFQTPVANPARDKRVDRNARATFGPADDYACRLVPEHEWRRAARIVTVIGVHVGAADPDRLDAHQHLVVAGRRFRLLAAQQNVRLGIDQRFHGFTLLKSGSAAILAEWNESTKRAAKTKISLSRPIALPCRRKMRTTRLE